METNDLISCSLLPSSVVIQSENNNGIGSDGNDSVINRNKTNLIFGYPSHMLTNLYCRCQLINKENIEHLTVS